MNASHIDSPFYEYPPQYKTSHRYFFYLANVLQPIHSYNEHTLILLYAFFLYQKHNKNILF